MGLFDKKTCDICGNRLRMFGNLELPCGNVCKDCAEQLSPWFDDSDLADLEKLKAYVEDQPRNQELVESFHITRKIECDSMFLLLDEGAGLFIVTDDDDLEFQNPDVFSLDDVVETNLEVEESEEELYEGDEDEDGDGLLDSPRELEYSYLFHIQIVLDHPYIREICFDLNDDTVDVEYEDSSVDHSGEVDPMGNEEYARYSAMADEILEALGDFSEEETETEQAWNGEFVICPYCDSKTRRTASGCCEFCGGTLSD